MPKRRIESPRKLIVRAWFEWYLSPKSVAFSINPVRAEDIAMYNRALPPHMCHGSALALVPGEAFGNMNNTNPTNHCKIRTSQKNKRLKLPLINGVFIRFMPDMVFWIIDEVIVRLFYLQEKNAEGGNAYPWMQAIEIFYVLLVMKL